MLHLNKLLLDRNLKDSCLPVISSEDPTSSDLSFVGLLNPGSGNKMGAVILGEASRSLSFNTRLLHIIYVCSNKDPRFKEGIKMGQILGDRFGRIQISFLDDMPAVPPALWAWWFKV